MLEAGQISLEMFEKAKVSKKKDRSLVTEADLAIESYFSERVKELPGEDVFIGEETSMNQNEESVKKALAGSAYVLDPIDGTINYASGLELWGISLGWMESGRLKKGAIYLPALEELVITTNEGLVSFRVYRGEIIAQERLLPGAGLNEESGLLAITQSIAKKCQVHLPNPVHSLGVAVYPLVNLLKAKYFAYIANVKIWDIAGALPMLEELGIHSYFWNGHEFGCEVNEKVYDLHEGADPRWGVKDFVVFCKPEHLEKILNGVERV